LFVCFSQSGDRPEEYVEKNLWLSTFSKISKPNLAIETKYEIQILFEAKPGYKPNMKYKSLIISLYFWLHTGNHLGRSGEF
jgi:hypothetical protein